MDENSVDNKQQDLNDLYAQLRSYGYSEDIVTSLVKKKEMDYENIVQFKDKVKISYMVPIRFITNWPCLDKKQRLHKLWELGFDTKMYSYVEDVCCYTFNNRRECGIVVWGNERTDKAYLNLVVEGKHVASDEARFCRDINTLQVMRGNKKS